MLFLFCFSTQDSFAQVEDKSYVIQIATFSSWDAMAKKQEIFYANTGTADNYIFAEKVGKRIKVYLFDSSQGDASRFYTRKRLNEVLKVVKANPNFKDAFPRSEGVNFENLTYYADAANKATEKNYPQEFSQDFTAKGVASSDDSGSEWYKVQLGVYKEAKSMDFIAHNYGFTGVNKDHVEDFVSHDFTRVNKNICRRYYFGNYNSKAMAMLKKKELEKSSKRKLMVVKR